MRQFHSLLLLLAAGISVPQAQAVKFFEVKVTGSTHSDLLRLAEEESARAENILLQGRLLRDHLEKNGLTPLV